ncbi:putative cysteine-rich receptor-like protein kinase 16 [Pistacia vera]|uniref:putative cysteine-rich receptor-like protein kinase 16 n=1 Tax=Pistacia vera TaxID=55513 RepID=UPI0012632492|nr:putative cysteine-rich receptor-like protein kinase 16 [Pistacia vera]
MRKLAMGSSYLLSIILYMFIISISVSTVDEFADICYEKGNFTRNSEYEKNRNAFLSSLATNVEINDGSYMAVLGQHSDRVYARAVCRGDSTNVSCASCVSSATDGLIAKCPNQKEGLSWGLRDSDSPCFVRYGKYSFFKEFGF